MTPSELQFRAEKAAKNFATSRRPIVLEFAGLPKAGKTTTLSQVHTFLKRCGFRVETVVERASVCPIRDKKHSNFNVWTACTTLAQLLEKTQDPPRVDDPQILILDRGIFDAVCWLTFMERLARIRKEERECIEKFLTSHEWRSRITGVILMTASAEDSMKREQGHLPVNGGAGSIMNDEVLRRMRETFDAVVERHSNHFRVFRVDTTTGGELAGPKETAEMVAGIVLGLIEEEIEEHILCLPKEKVLAIIGGPGTIKGETALKLVMTFEREGRFIPRAKAEGDTSLIQALPVVIVRNKSGQVLRLKRRERSSDNPLHEKTVIWAGGHVRREDAAEGTPVVAGALRELDEELRLSVPGDALRLLGATYSEGSERTAKHLALVFEWRAETDDVAVALSNAEFFERRGTSLSGTFVDIDVLADEIDDKKMEAWTGEIIRNLLPNGAARLQPRLF